MPMRLCSVCLRPTNGEPKHAACQKPNQYAKMVHQRMGAIYRINNVPCIECGRTGTEDNPIEAAHKISVNDGGLPVPENYEPKCRECNAKQGRRSSHD